MKHRLPPWGILTRIVVVLLLVSSLSAQPVAAVEMAPQGAGWAWQNPLPQGNGIWSLWGSSATDIFAVGYYGTILHYDGTNWSLMASASSESRTVCGAPV